MDRDFDERVAGWLFLLLAAVRLLVAVLNDLHETFFLLFGAPLEEDAIALRLAGAFAVAALLPMGTPALATAVARSTIKRVSCTSSSSLSPSS
jgi:hypothetical protein